MFVEFGNTPTVLLVPIRSPANLNAKIVSQIFVSEHCGIFYLVKFFFSSEHCGIFYHT